MFNIKGKAKQIMEPLLANSEEKDSNDNILPSNNSIN